MDIAKPTLWFSPKFLGKPPLGWSVDWDHIDHTTPKPISESASAFDRDEWHGCEYMAGILIKHIGSGHVWRLTGVSTGKYPNEMMEGKWPD
jgi:hypothetical protein